jgi:hypothetical protein
MKEQKLHDLFAAIDEANEELDLSFAEWTEINSTVREMLPPAQRTAYNIGILVGFWIALNPPDPSSESKETKEEP